ncbi:hypothetical protein SESBI_39770 [Sesbania bispinosa]|nr:hypothetical protein SESBI_39770 [Sesbania bispinosa]
MDWEKRRRWERKREGVKGWPLRLWEQGVAMEGTVAAAMAMHREGVTRWSWSQGRRSMAAGQGSGVGRGTRPPVCGCARGGEEVGRDGDPEFRTTVAAGAALARPWEVALPHPVLPILPLSFSLNPYFTV